MDITSYLLGKKASGGGGGGGSSEYFLQSNQVDGQTKQFTTFIQDMPYEYIDFTGISTAQNFFSGCNKLKKIAIRNTESLTPMGVNSLFSGCTSLEILDIRDLLLDSLGVINMFGGSYSSGTRVPDNCLIIVKSDTEKTWMANNLSRYTNVVTVDEYNAMQ